MAVPHASPTSTAVRVTGEPGAGIAGVAEKFATVTWWVTVSVTFRSSVVVRVTVYVLGVVNVWLSVLEAPASVVVPSPKLQL